MLFAVFHRPNPFLVPLTLLAGALYCWLYDRATNLLALGLGHALLGTALSHSLPLEITFGMHVGPGFWPVWEQLHGAGVAG